MGGPSKQSSSAADIDELVDAQELDHSIECDGDVCECPSIAGHNGSPASSASAARVATGSAPGAVAGG